MKGTVMRKLKNEKISAMYDSYTGNLLTKASVEVDEGKLNDIKIKPAGRPTMGLPQQPGGMKAHPPGK